jgi:tripartite-type tricarboxylate transporter receptor subunit TctC
MMQSYKILLLSLFLTACGNDTSETIEVAEQVSITEEKPIQFISSFTATGSSGKTARIIQPALENFYGRPVEIIYNQGGRGGDIGARLAASANPDTLTLFAGTVGNVALLPSVLSTYEIEPLKDFRAVSKLTDTPDVLIVHTGLGISNLAELVDYARTSGKTLSYSYIAPLSIHRMEFVQLLDDLGIEATVDASIRGSVAAMDAVSNGSIDLAMTTAPYVAPLVEQGAVVPLAVAHFNRLPAFPDVPTMVESGIDIAHGSWSGVLVPAATSDEDLQLTYNALRAALTDPSIIAQLAELGMVANPSASPEAFADYIAEETTRLENVARQFNIRED